MADFILMPQMGVSEESALLSEWKVKEGDVIKLEQPIFGRVPAWNSGTKA